MIRKFRESLFGKSMSMLMLFTFLLDIIVPFQHAYGLTGGAAQPEFNSFTPIGTSDMVDLSSGDFSYNIPVMDIGGFPINLAYSSGVTMDQEATWVGLGWNLSIGQINRQMRGIPDDFKGDPMTYESDMKDNYTVGASFTFSPQLAGVEILNSDGSGTGDTAANPLSFNVGITAQYNSYTGMSLVPSAGVSFDISDNASAGLNVRSDENGLTVSPNLSLHAKIKKGKLADNTLGSNFGVSFNARQGLSNFNMSVSRKAGVLNGKKKNKVTNKSWGMGSTINFLDNHYTPTIQDGLTSFNFTFNAALGSELFAAEGSGQITAFGSNQYIPDAQKSQIRPAFGYDNNHLANNSSIRDFNREKDGNFSVNSTNLPLTNYTYDIYNVQGQGVGGTFRPYRSQVGFVTDNNLSNTGGGIAAGAEFGGGQAFHLGTDIEVTVTNSFSGSWDEDEGNNAVKHFDRPDAISNNLYEEVYYKNVGDLAVDQEHGLYGTNQTKLGEYSPIRLQLGGDKFDRTVENTYEIKHNTSPNAHYIAPFSSEFKRDERVKRNQAIIKISNGEITNDDGTLLGFVSNPNALTHHTAGFIVTRNDGARYIYGDALYNTTKEEVTFAAEGLTSNCSTGLVNYNPGSDNSFDNTRGDQYFNRIITGPYAHTFLLTALLSTDYSDVDGVEGPSEGDFGSYTLFTYSNPLNYNWRVPFSANTANFNEGLKTDPTDDKGSYVYGEKETKYLEKIETKTHVAIFHTSDREDGRGVSGENGGIGSGSMKKLDKISLYSRGEYYDDFGNVIAGAVPIKEAHFVYNYTLCTGIPNRATAGGKLTLERFYFTYRGSNMGQYSDYEFNYGDTDHNGTPNPERNKPYNLKGYDIWGCYKPNSATTTCGPLDPITAPEFMYLDQEDPNLDDYTANWTITDIELPSGGKIQVDYETDDYQYVQDKKAMQMFNVAGAGPDANPSSSTYFNPGVADDENSLLYKSGPSNDEAEYLYIKLPSEDNGINSGQFRNKYLLDLIFKYDNLVQFRFMMNMNHKGGKNSNWESGFFEYVTGYFKLDWGGTTTFNHTDGNTYASIKMELVDLEGGFAGGSDMNPIAKAGFHFGRKYMPKYIYGLPDQNNSASESEIVNSILQSADNLTEIFTGANGLLKTKEIGRRFIPEKSWIRLMNPNKHKKGGGCRVKQIAMTDDWANMTSLESGGYDDTRDQKYGQVYEYTLEDGSSSGVAAYEPTGSKENPFVQPVFVNEQRLLAPDEENFMEKPFGESFFPSPTITYSRVSVKNLERYEDVGNDLDPSNDLVVNKHATGHVVTEFYTSRDYPTITDQTELKVHEDKSNPLFNLLNINVRKHITLTQGYVIHINDMNGKMKSQRVYAEGQEDYISGVDYIYDGFSTTADPDDPFTLVVNNEGRINNSVLTLSPDGKIETNTLGVEYDIINDFREMKSATEVVGVNFNVATFFVGIIPGIIPVPLPDYAHHEDKLNMVTTTKVINTFGVQREVIAHDAGASVYTRNLLWDSSTGEVLLTETVNEYGDKYYSFNFPAHWYYDGMGLASENVGATVPFVTSGSSYTTVGFQPPNAVYENGDEVLLYSGTQKLYGWVDNVSASSFDLIDKDGNPIVISAPVPPIPAMVSRIIRSGKRNIQSTSMASVVMMTNPLSLVSGSQLPPNFLSTNTWYNNKIVNAGAVEFSDDWELQCECGVNNITGGPSNKYVNNVRGVWRALKSHLYLTGRHQNTGNPDPRNDGFYNDFSPFYAIDGVGNWHINSTNWTFTSEVSQFSPYGFELENVDALKRFSAAQYGYNFTFPLAVGANTRYSELGYDGFEDYNFAGCDSNEHFGFRDILDPDNYVTPNEHHTGSYSIRVKEGGKISKIYHLDCQ